MELIFGVHLSISIMANVVQKWIPRYCSKHNKLSICILVRMSSYTDAFHCLVSFFCHKGMFDWLIAMHLFF